MQEIIFIFYARVFYTFSTVFNKVMNIVFIFAGKRIPNIRKMSELRKLKITEMNRLTVEEFKEVDKLPLVVVLDEVRSLHNIGAVFRTSDAFLVNCIYLCGITATPSGNAQNGLGSGVYSGLEVFQAYARCCK